MQLFLSLSGSHRVTAELQSCHTSYFSFLVCVSINRHESFLFWGGTSIHGVPIRSCTGSSSPEASLGFLVLSWAMAIQLVSVADWQPLTVALQLPVLWFSSLSPPRLSAGLRLLIISCLSCDQPPSGPGRNHVASEAADWTRSQPTGASDHLANNDSCSCQSS